MERQPYLRLNLVSESAGRSLNVEQLVAMLKKKILQETHARGCRLPPVRALAVQLGVSKNTIQTTYEELQAQGLVESKDRTGFFIAQGEQPQAFENPLNVPSPDFIPAEPDTLAPSHSTIQKMISLGSVFVDARILPIEKINACFRSVLKSGLDEFSHSQGHPALREKIAVRLRDRGMNVDAENIIMTNGSQQALDIVTRVIQTKVIATEDPAYHLAKHLFRLNGLQPIGLPIDPLRGLDEDVWRQKLSTHRPGLVYLTTNFQNPNGYSYSSQEISKIVQWAQEYNFGILEDDWGADMRSYSEFRPGLRAMGGSNVLYMNSFTKKLLPSLRIGYLVANSKTIDSLMMAKRLSTLSNPSLIESALFEFLDRGYYDTHLRYVQEEVDVRYENCLRLLREKMPEEVQWTTPGGGPVLWLELPTRVNIPELSMRMKDKGVLVSNSKAAFFGQPHCHGFKLGYAAITQNEMEMALDHLSKEIGRQLAL